MRQRRFTDETVVAIVRGSGRKGVTAEWCAQQNGITPTTLFRWQKRIGGTLSDVHRRRAQPQRPLGLPAGR